MLCNSLICLSMLIFFLMAYFENIFTRSNIGFSIILKNTHPILAFGV